MVGVHAAALQLSYYFCLDDYVPGDYSPQAPCASPSD
jgi:hypothetical protein